jgi:hypothetical protein
VTVTVPRCSACRGRQRRETTIVLSSLALGVVLFAGSYLLVALARGTPPFTIFGSSTATAVTLAVAGFSFGLLMGVLISARVNRGAPRRDARNHPDVVTLTNQGWSYDPPSGD